MGFIDPTVKLGISPHISPMSMVETLLQKLKRMTPPLAYCFTPGPFDVICARGSEARNHSGNNTFKQNIIESIEIYAKADSKLYKSLVVSSVVNFF
jgi:hypothetical protein